MFTLNCRGRLLSGDRPLIMGIINVTPDSFYGGSRFTVPGEWLEQAGKMIREGADILDIGGQSTRPDAEEVGLDEELERAVGAIGAIHGHFPGVLLSIDTYRAKVAQAAIAAGASMVNDISGGQFDPDMLDIVAAAGLPYVCMHMRGTPATMKTLAVYEDLTAAVLDFFVRRLEDCRKAGIHDVILDPGLGFAKNAGHNFELLRNLAVLKMPGRPLLLGVSRKSFIYKTLGVPVEQALNGTTVLHTLALLNGAAILRVHDPAAAREAILLFQAYKKTRDPRVSADPPSKTL
jgi:dihydropteroate synthase